VKEDTQPTYRRQRFLLSFINHIEGSVTLTELQKLVFLHTMNAEDSFYDFIPYKFGAYSFQLAEDLDILRRDGYIKKNNNRVQRVGNTNNEGSFFIVTERGNNLVRKAYNEYPYYTINSELTNKLFKGEEATRLLKEKAKYQRTSHILYTIGYEGKSIESFINLLIENRVRLLCDVRKNPLSRKFGFSKSKLEHITGTVGIKYIHIPDLGIESELRKMLETPEDYSSVFNSYIDTLSDLEPYIDWVKSLFDTYKCIALMCYESDAKMCHRHIISDYITDAHNIRSKEL